MNTAHLRFDAGGTRSRDWRVICTCQLHKRSMADRIGIREALRNRYTAALLSATVAFTGVGLPMKAMTNTLRSIAASKAAVVVREQERPLPLITPRIRSEFALQIRTLDHFTLERIREQFFRTEIPFGSLIYTEAGRNHLSPELLAAVVKTESDFRPHLCSNKNAMGLMQIIPSTGELMGAKDLYDPQENIRAGARYLRYLTRQFDGDQTLVLAAYNAGETVVRKYGGVPPYKETQDYLLRVNASARDFEKRLTTHVYSANTLSTAVAR